MKNRLLILYLLSAFVVYGQKTEEKIIDNKAIESIFIEGDAIFKIDIITSASKNIKITSKIEGEYAQSTKVVTKINKNSLLITCDYPELNNKTDDKLNAHKVHSIEISIEAPKYLNINIKSAIASARISGIYNYLLLELNQGNAKVFNFLGNATINTYNGNISLETNNAKIKAKTKTGILKTEKITKGQHEIKINSINGNINIKKSN